MMEALYFSETSVLTRALQRHIPQDGILHVKQLLRREIPAAERRSHSYTDLPGTAIGLSLSAADVSRQQSAFIAFTLNFQRKRAMPCSHFMDGLYGSSVFSGDISGN
jgi:hypothetical protein